MIFLWNGHTMKVILVSGRLKITATQQQIDFKILLLFDKGNSIVYLFELPVSTPLNSNLHFVKIL